MDAKGVPRTLRSRCAPAGPPTRRTCAATATNGATRAAAPLAAFVLHRYDWSEIQRHRRSLHARAGPHRGGGGARRSRVQPARPCCCPSSASTSRSASCPKARARGDIQTLRQGQWAGRPAACSPARRCSAGFYLNELLMKLLARHDPHPALFDAYAADAARAGRRRRGCGGNRRRPRASSCGCCARSACCPTGAGDADAAAAETRGHYALRPSRGRPGGRGRRTGRVPCGAGLRAAGGAGTASSMRCSQTCAPALPALKRNCVPASLSSRLHPAAHAAGDAATSSALTPPSMNPLVTTEAWTPGKLRATALSVNVNKVALLRNTRHLASRA